MTAESRKVTITIPQHLLEFADRRAARINTSRSQVISQALAEAELREQELAAAAGYRFYAGEAMEFAEATSRLVAEASVTARDEATDGETW